ncbi:MULTISPECIES: hypothetical protein [Acinetobacter]|nr:hypothetical protein [Acinetobacter sp. HR7]
MQEDQQTTSPAIQPMQALTYIAAASALYAAVFVILAQLFIAAL